jgi:hypothetical protein
MDTGASGPISSWGKEACLCRAGDKTKFPEQLEVRAQAWSAKRLLFNTFNFYARNVEKEAAAMPNRIELNAGE